MGVMGWAMLISRSQKGSRIPVAPPNLSSIPSWTRQVRLPWSRLGPLTNIALAVMLEPKIAENVKEVVLMGGAANAQGNASATAEANIRNDPEAAKIVFEAPWKVTMVGLDVTRQSIMTPAYVEQLKSAGNKYTDFIGQILPHYMGFYKQSTGLDGLYVHDSSALAYVIDPSLVHYPPPLHTRRDGQSGEFWPHDGGLAAEIRPKTPTSMSASRSTTNAS